MIVIVFNNNYTQIKITQRMSVPVPASEHQQYITARGKKITELAGVLERQKQKVKELLSQQKSRQQNKQARKAEEQGRQCRQQNASKQNNYQKICEQVVEIGNRVLPSARKYRPDRQEDSQRDKIEERERERQKEREKDRESQIEKEKQQEKEGEITADKEIQYLKSEEYRLYLESITKDHPNTNNLIKKMRETRNNNAYLAPSQREPPLLPRNIPSSRPHPIQSASPTNFILPASHLPFKNVSYTPPPFKRDTTIVLDEKSLYQNLQLVRKPAVSPGRRMIVFPPNIVPLSPVGRGLSYSPTMKDIQRAVSQQKHEKLKKDKQNRMQIESKTVQLSLKCQDNPSDKNVIKNIKAEKAFLHSVNSSEDREQVRQFKEWKLEHILSSTSKSKVNMSKGNDCSLVGCQKRSKKQKTPKKTDVSRKLQKQSACFKLYIQNKENIDDSSFSQVTPHKKQPQYVIEFKISQPQQSKVSQYACSGAKGSKQQELQIKYLPRKQYRQREYTACKLESSRTSSAVTQSDQVQPAPSKSSYKLSLVTPSRKDKR